MPSILDFAFLVLPHTKQLGIFLFNSTITVKRIKLTTVIKLFRNRLHYNNNKIIEDESVIHKFEVIFQIPAKNHK